MRHPGWTYRDLQETPADIVKLVRYIDQAENKAREARTRREANGGD